ncbi:Acetyltransferase [Streptococcus sp. DD10]|uniref:GNAT family N-acetyltransferase n=1 Tax=Streptococcus sp. DD10 TaxID=1777878 RepID=UPI0007934C9E|nr:GNAT family N-acetyltransferase [Streptococcus sp. DD10]KXT72774.1 Acetyltransferase [Streptococcus sp. DD10]
MELRRPTLADKDAILAMIAEFEQEASPHDGGFWDWEDFVYEDWLASNQDAEIGLHLPDGWVPAIQLVGFEDGVAVGFLNLRLRLSDYLLHQGGHIGYSVRPSQRGKGFAKAMLEQSLLLSRGKNIHRTLVTCHQDNPASRAVIIANGGVLEDVRDGVERYWID